MVGQSSPDNADTFFGDGEVNYRTFPSPEYIWAVIKRNAFIVGFIAFTISPVVAIKALTTTKIYESSVILRFDPADSFQAETRSSEAIFLEVMQQLSRELDDQTFLEDLAQRFPPTLSEYPGYVLTGRYPELQMLKWFISAPQKEPDASKRAKYLKSRVILGADTSIRGNTSMRLTATGPTLEDAQKLATTTSNLLTEKFYKNEIERVAVGVKSISDFVSSEKVKKLVENARQETTDLPDIMAPKKNNLQVMKDIKSRQTATKSRIREINEEIRATVARRAQLDASLAELARRYGPFHPERKAVEAEIAEMRGKDGMASLSRELRSLEAQLADAEADADSIVAAEETEERADKMILKIFGRLDRLKLEQQRLEEQIHKPDQRTRLAQVGPPSTPLNPISKRIQIVIIGAVGALAFGIVIALIREFTQKKAIDKWRIDWILNVPCVLRFSTKNLSRIPPFEKKSIQNLRQRISAGKQKDQELEVFLDYRAFGLWVKNRSKGQVLLFIRSSQNPCNVNFINRFASVYSRDYAGKYLVIDMNASSGSESLSPDDRSNALLEIILQKRTLESVLSKANPDRGFDQLIASPGMESRLSEVISSAKFAEFLMAARRIYHKIFIVGLGAHSFVENDSLFARSSDCLVIVDTQATTLQDLKNIKNGIGQVNIGGYVLIEG